MKGQYQTQVKIFRVLAQPVRLQILARLAEGPACVCDLILATGCRQANVSQHLMLLRSLGLVRAEREGRNIRYSLANPCVVYIMQASDRAVEFRRARKAVQQ